MSDSSSINREVNSEKDSSESAAKSGVNIQGGKIIGSSIGQGSSVQANIIADSVGDVGHVSSGINSEDLASFLAIVQNIRTTLPEASEQLDQYQTSDVEHSLKDIESQVQRPKKSINKKFVLESIERVRKLLAGIAVFSPMIKELVETGKKLFGS